jgi:hypothetical protein
MLYELLQSHPLLTEKVRRLDGPTFEAQVATAEALLGLTTIPVVRNTNKVPLVLLALAHQVNFQVEQGVDPFIAESTSSSHSQQSVVYRYEYLDPRAVAILAKVIGVAYHGYTEKLTSVRTEGGAKLRERGVTLRDFR